MIYYIYMYLDQNNIPFYIGKGKDNRYKVQQHLGTSHSNAFLQNKIRKVGVENIKIHFPHKDLDEEQAFYLEEYYIAGYGRRDLGLGPLCNLTDGGDGPSGIIVSNETRKKMSDVAKDRIVSNETRKKMSESATGRKLSDGAKRKLSEFNKGHIVSNKTRQKISGANKGRLGYWSGKKLSEETRQKLSEAHKGQIAWNKGKKMPEETKRKLREVCKGKKHTKETKQKLSIAAKNSWKTRKMFKGVN